MPPQFLSPQRIDYQINGTLPDHLKIKRIKKTTKLNSTGILLGVREPHHEKIEGEI